MIWYIIIPVFLILLFAYRIKCYHKNSEKIDGVETIDGIRYLVTNTDVNYIMYKLGSTINSKIIKETSFEKVNDHEGILTFGGVAYYIGGGAGSENDMDIGAAYRVKCTQSDSDVIMEVSFVKRDFKLGHPSLEQPGLLLNQAYHRFFKEVFDVKVI